MEDEEIIEEGDRNWYDNGMEKSMFRLLWKKWASLKFIEKILKIVQQTI